MQIYTVVDVWRGIAIGAKSFPTRHEAEIYLHQLRKSRNSEEDDVQLFEDHIGETMG